MSEPSLEAQVEAARAYEALFVPALFGPWASNVADVAQIASTANKCSRGLVTFQTSAHIVAATRS